MSNEWWTVGPPGYKLMQEIEKKKRRLLPPSPYDDTDLEAQTPQGQSDYQPPQGLTDVLSRRAGLERAVGIANRFPIQPLSREPVSPAVPAQRPEEGFTPFEIDQTGIDRTPPGAKAVKWYEENINLPGAMTGASLLEGKGFSEAVPPGQGLTEEQRQKWAGREWWATLPYEILFDPANLLPGSIVGRKAMTEGAEAASRAIVRTAKKLPPVATQELGFAGKLPGGAGKVPKGKIPPIEPGLAQIKALPPEHKQIIVNDWQRQLDEAGQAASEMQAELEIFKEELARNPANDYVNYIQKTGGLKGEIDHLTPAQVLKITGRPPTLGMYDARGKIPFENALDYKASELYPNAERQGRNAVDVMREEILKAKQARQQIKDFEQNIFYANDEARGLRGKIEAVSGEGGMTTGAQVQTGMGIGEKQQNVSMLGEFKDIGKKQSLIDTEALKAKAAAKPLPGQTALPQAGEADIFAKVNSLRQQADEAWSRAAAAPSQTVATRLGKEAQALEAAWSKEAQTVGTLAAKAKPPAAGTVPRKVYGTNEVKDFPATFVGDSAVVRNEIRPGFGKGVDGKPAGWLVTDKAGNTFPEHRAEFATQKEATDWAKAKPPAAETATANVGLKPAVPPVVETPANVPVGQGNAPAVEPTRVYHGTDMEFPTFDISQSKKWNKFALWFTDNKESATSWGKNIKEADININNPKILTDSEWYDIQMSHAKDANWFSNWKSALRNDGYDGLKIEQVDVNGKKTGNIWAVFDNEKVVPPAVEPVPPTRVTQGEAAIQPLPLKEAPARATETPLAAAPQTAAGGTPPIQPPRIGKPPISEIEADTKANRFVDYLFNPESKRDAEFQREVMSVERGKRADNALARLRQLQIEQGENFKVDDALQQVAQESLSGKLPRTKGFSEILDEETRQALFAKVYYKLQDNLYELESTATALRHALGEPGVAPKAIPDIVGAKGGSARTRLEYVFGRESSIMKMLNNAKKLQQQFEERSLSGPARLRGEFDPNPPPNVPFGTPRLWEKPGDWEKWSKIEDGLRYIEQLKKDLIQAEEMAAREARWRLQFQNVEYAPPKNAQPTFWPEGIPGQSDLLGQTGLYPKGKLVDIQGPLDIYNAAHPENVSLKQDFINRNIKKTLIDAEEEATRRARFLKWVDEQNVKFEPEIEDARNQLELIPKAQQNALIRGLKEAGLTTIDIGNFMRANKASLDNSWKRQQAFLLISGGREAFWNAEVKSWQAMLNPEVAKASWYNITHDPLYAIYDKVTAKQGRDFLRPLELKKGVSPSAGVEEFGFTQTDRPIPRFTEKIPYVKGSQDAFITGINEHNWWLFKDYYKKMLQRNEDIALGKVKLGYLEKFDIEKQMGEYATFLADMSGRAGLGPARELAPALNATLFATRFKLGRLISPRHLVSPNPMIRKEAWKAYTSTIGTVMALEYTGERFGLWEVGKDEKSSTYLKVRVGNTWYDPWAGTQQNWRFAIQMATGKATGLTGEDYSVNRLQSAARLLRGIVAPLPSLGWDIATGKTFAGYKLDFKSPGQWVDRLAPMVVNDAIEAFSESGPVIGTVTTGLAVEGMSTYSPPNTALFSSWRKDFAEYNEIPTNTNEVRAKVGGRTREEYLKNHIEVDAKLVLTGQKDSFSTPQAMVRAVKLVKDNKIDVMNLPIVTQYLKEKEDIENLNKKNMGKPGYRRIIQPVTETTRFLRNLGIK